MRVSNLYLILLQITICLCVCEGLSAQTAKPTRTLVRAGKVLDVHTGKEAIGQTIIVTGDRITAIAPTTQTPAQAGDKEIDLSHYTIMPGLIDAHTHLTMATNFDPYWELSMTPAKEGIIGVENAKSTLEAGFTTVRNVGADDYADVALRDEINAGRVPGPAYAGVGADPEHYRRPRRREPAAVRGPHVGPRAWRTAFLPSSKKFDRTSNTART